MPSRTSSRRRVTGPDHGSPVTRSLRRGSLPAVLAVVATAIALLLLPSAASGEGASAADPCTAGYTCTTTCAIDASGNGGFCVVRECAAADACQETNVAVPAAALDGPRNCRLDRITCDIVSEAPARCEVSGDGFGAVCTLASREWRRCVTRDEEQRCQTVAVGGDPFVVAGAHYPPPQAPPDGTPTTPPPPSDPGTTPPSSPAPSAPAPQPEPAPSPTPQPTAPGQPAPDKPTPVAAPAQPATKAPARKRRRALVAVIRFRSGFGLPPGFRRADTCHGSVRLRLRAGRRMLAAKTVRLDRRCRYAAAFRIRRARLRGANVVTIVARFRGNDVLGATGRAYRFAVPR